LVQGSLRVQSHPHHHHHEDDGGHTHKRHEDGKSSGHGSYGGEDDSAGLGSVRYDALKDGEILVGRMECSFGPVGLRIQMDKFPSTARLEFFPEPRHDENSHMWCRPLTSCSGAHNATVAWERPEGGARTNGKVLALTPAAGSTGSGSTCGWPTFALKGSVAAGDDGLKFKGQLSSSTVLGTGLIRKPEPVVVQPSWLPPKCAMLYNAVQMKMPAGVCSSFTATVCRRDAKFEEGDKVIYFIRHGEQRNQPDDGSLTTLGERQVRNLRSNPLLARALSLDPRQRAEVILASPMARTMQTAVVGFGDLGIKTELDMNLIELANEPTKSEGVALLKKMGLDRLLNQYEEMWRRTDKGEELAWARPEGAHPGPAALDERVARFIQGVLRRPERRIIVVGHNNYFKSTGIYVKGFGTMAVRVLGRNGRLRETSPPQCWPESMAPAV